MPTRRIQHEKQHVQIADILPWGVDWELPDGVTIVESFWLDTQGNPLANSTEVEVGDGATPHANGETYPEPTIDDGNSTTAWVWSINGTKRKTAINRIICSDSRQANKPIDMFFDTP